MQRIEDRVITHKAIFNLRSSILDPRSSILDPRTAIPVDLLISFSP